VGAEPSPFRAGSRQLSRELAVLWYKLLESFERCALSSFQWMKVLIVISVDINWVFLGVLFLSLLEGR
jgi:hypothetical protein